MTSSSSTELSSSPQTLREDEEGYNRRDKDDEIYQDDNAQSPQLHTPSAYDIDSRVGPDKFASVPHNSEWKHDRQHPTIELPTPKPVADEVDARIITEPNEAIPGWLFGQPLRIPDFSSDSSDAKDLWAPGPLDETSRAQMRFPIDTNFTVESREAWTNGKEKARTESAVDPSPCDRRYNLRSRHHRIDSVLISAPEEPFVRDEPIGLAKDFNQSTSRSNSTSRSTMSGNVSCASTHFRKRLATILPMDIREQLREDPNRCVAPTAKPGHPRCKIKTKGSLDVVNSVPSTLTGSTIDSADAASLAFV